MTYNHYISGLLELRRRLDNRIDNEIEDCMRNRGNSESLKESLLYILNDNAAINGAYKKEETVEEMKERLRLWQDIKAGL